MHIRAARLNRRQRPVRVDVAGTCAIPEFTDHVVTGRWFHEFRVLLRSEARSVTGRAIRFVGGEFPRHRLRIRRVASAACDRHPVIGIEWRTVPISHRCPCRRAMTGLAWHCRREVPGSLSDCRRTVVAARTRRRQHCVVHPRAGKGDSALVAGVARCIGCHVLRRLADRDRAGVAGRARSRDAAVVQPRAGKGGRALVASVARCIGRHSASAACRSRSRRCDRSRTQP